jgi:hypothetical protein
MFGQLLPNKNKIATVVNSESGKADSGKLNTALFHPIDMGPIPALWDV